MGVWAVLKVSGGSRRDLKLFGRLRALFGVWGFGAWGIWEI